jgi:hypothetical protein
MRGTYGTPIWNPAAGRLSTPDRLSANAFETSSRGRPRTPETCQTGATQENALHPPLSLFCLDHSMNAVALQIKSSRRGTPKQLVFDPAYIQNLLPETFYRDSCER